MTEGASNEFRKQFYVKSSKYYNYLQSSVSSIPGVDEEEAFTHFNIALRLFDIPELLIDQFFKILMAILYLGNIEFSDESLPCKIKSTKKSIEALELSSELLGIDKNELLFSLTITKLTMKKEIIEKPNTKEQCIIITNTFAKSLYHKLFHWIVNKINETTSIKFTSSSTSKNCKNHFIGILDIFGFENFEKNSYEQFLINYANEKFQQLQNHYIFDIEQREYLNEGISWKKIDNSDNQAILRLIETPPLSILSILREGSRFPNASSDSFIRKLHKQFHNDPIYEIPPLHSDSQFILKHYPGKVIYTVDNWIDKDSDTFPLYITEMIETKCTNKLISLIFSNENQNNDQNHLNSSSIHTNTNNNNQPSSSALSTSTISFQFKIQLKELMNTIHLTNPLFIRCIKPNQIKEKNYYDKQLITSQLRCTGMLNCIQIRKLGYPVRYKYDEFLSKYSIIIDKQNTNNNNNNHHHYLQFNKKNHHHSSSTSSSSNSPKKLCKKLIDRFKKRFPTESKNSIEIGKTKILLKSNFANLLDYLRGEILHQYVITLQSWWRMIDIRFDLSSKKSSIIIIQKTWRFYNSRKNYLKTKNSILKIQNFYRFIQGKKTLKNLKFEKLQQQQQQQQKLNLDPPNRSESTPRTPKTPKSPKKQRLKASRSRQSSFKLESESDISLSETSTECSEKSSTSTPCLSKNKKRKSLNNNNNHHHHHNDNDSINLLTNFDFIEKIEENQNQSQKINKKKRKKSRRRSTDEKKLKRLSNNKLKQSKTETSIQIKNDKESNTSSSSSQVINKKKHSKRSSSFRNKSSSRIKRKSKIKNLRYDFICNSNEGGGGGFGHSNDGSLPMDCKEILIGTSWNLLEQIDIDSCCLFYEYNQFIDVIWQFNNISKDRSSQFLGFPKWLPKNQQIDCEQIRINLSKLPQSITTIFVSLIIFSPGFTWKSVEKSSIRILTSSLEGVDAEWKEHIQLNTFPNAHNDDNSAKIFCKIARNGFSWVVSPIDLIAPARTYKALLPHLEDLLDSPPPSRKIHVGIHRAENLSCAARSAYVTKYYVSVALGEEKAVTSPVNTTSPVWNSLLVVDGVSPFLIISVFRKKSALLRIERKLVGSIHVALTDESLGVQESWFDLPGDGRILLSIFEKNAK